MERVPARHALAASLLLPLILLACQGSGLSHRLVASSLESTPLAGRGDPADGGSLFVRLPAEQTGIDWVHQFEERTDLDKQALGTGFAGGGVSVGDFDNDGWPDLYLTGRAGNKLYRNLGKWKFEDVTERAGVDGNGRWSGGTSFVDIDNDANLDLYVCVFGGSNLLYVNRGDGTFEERADSYGLDVNAASVMMAFADYDRDGDLDGYLLTNANPQHRRSKLMQLRKYAQGGTPFVKDAHGELTLKPDLRGMVNIVGIRKGKRVLNLAADPDRLLRNEGDGSFTDVTGEVGIGDYFFGLGVTWWDYNDDGWPDLYVSNDFYGPDRLYRNNRDGSFTNVVDKHLPHTPWFSMGSDAADINNDGLIDFLASDMSSTTHYMDKLSMGNMDKDRWFLTSSEPRQYPRNTVYLNTGTDRFMEVAFLVGLASTDWSWSVKFGDLDNDGWVDVFFTNGMTSTYSDSDRRKAGHEKSRSSLSALSPVFRDNPVRRESNLAFQNLGGLKFTEATADWGLEQVGISHGAALADLDRDGDLDLVTCNFKEALGVYENRGTSGAGLLVRLRGTASNSYGIDSKVTVETTSGLQVRHLTLARGYMSTNEPLVHFGLGSAEAIQKLTVDWPSGRRQVFTDLEAQHLYTVTEPEDTSPPEPRARSESGPMFLEREWLAGWRHREQAYDDYRDQPLLPNKLSQLGPGLAWGDVDGDGREDLYVGGAANHAGMLWLNREAGRFVASPSPAFERDAPCEDMAPLFLDADADGDMDLYVVSGGVESPAGSERMYDRLYLNDGSGAFAKAPPGTLPELGDSGGVVVAGDFDRDGDLDLFVGGRVIPGQYPLEPNSRLLCNERGRFADCTDRSAPALRNSGLVTSAVWSDADGDDWLDLLVTHEWGPIKFFRNDRGRLVDRTEQAALGNLLGWWNGIAARDIDGDGDIDYVATNFGLNTKYGKPKPDKPTMLYYGDFDGSGDWHLVETKQIGHDLYPVRGKSCSTSAMPMLEEKFPTFHLFASATLPEIYPDEHLQNARRFDANTLESGVLVNDGKGRFEFRALPALAQSSPAFGVVLTEIDGDAQADLYVVGNFFSPQPETGRMDGGLSLLLRGTDDGQFATVWPRDSGLIVPGDAKSLTVADVNDDGWSDFVIGVNDGPVQIFERQPPDGHATLSVRLRGRPGNLTGVGARVRAKLPDGTVQTAEVQAGGGYLSQSSSALIFGLNGAERATEIEVRWPDGLVTSTAVEAGQRHLVVQQPAREVAVSPGNAPPRGTAE